MMLIMQGVDSLDVRCYIYVSYFICRVYLVALYQNAGKKQTVK